MRHFLHQATLDVKTWSLRALLVYQVLNPTLLGGAAWNEASDKRASKRFKTYAFGIRGVEEPPGMTHNKLSQPPMTPPGKPLINKKNDLKMAAKKSVRSFVWFLASKVEVRKDVLSCSKSPFRLKRKKKQKFPHFLPNRFHQMWTQS